MGRLPFFIHTGLILAVKTDVFDFDNEAGNPADSHNTIHGGHNYDDLQHYH